MRLGGRGIARASGNAGDALFELRILAPPLIDAGLGVVMQD